MRNVTIQQQCDATRNAFQLRLAPMPLRTPNPAITRRRLRFRAKNSLAIADNIRPIAFRPPFAAIFATHPQITPLVQTCRLNAFRQLQLVLGLPIIRPGRPSMPPIRLLQPKNEQQGIGPLPGGRVIQSLSQLNQMRQDRSALSRPRPDPLRSALVCRQISHLLSLPPRQRPVQNGHAKQLATPVITVSNDLRSVRYQHA